MEVVQGNAEEFLHFFHAKQNEIVVAILILSFRRKEVELFSALIDGVTEIDQALGPEIGLFLFAPDADTAVEAFDRGHHFLAGERFNVGGWASRASDFFENSNPRQYDPRYYPEIKQAVARSSTKVVPDFCKIFDIDTDALPCVCTIIKESDRVIISRAGDRLSFDALVRVAINLKSNLALIKQRINFATRGIEGLREWLAATQAADARIKLCETKIVEYATSLQRKYKIVLAPQIKANLRSGNFSVQAFDRLLIDVAGDQFEKISKNSRTRGLRSRTEEWQLKNLHLNDFIRLNDVNGLQRTKDFCEELASDFEHSVASAMSKSGITMRRYRDYIGTVGKISGAVAFLTKAVAFLKTLDGGN